MVLLAGVGHHVPAGECTVQTRLLVYSSQEVVSESDEAELSVEAG